MASASFMAGLIIMHVMLDPNLLLLLHSVAAQLCIHAASLRLGR
jgi:hypothetical protein